MWAITLKRIKTAGLIGSVQLKFALTYVALIVGLLLLLNTYPMMISRDLVFAAKQESLTSQALGVSQHLSGGVLETEAIGASMGFLDVHNLDRIVVTDQAGLVLYDTVYGGKALEEHTWFRELSRAPLGYEVFFSAYSGGSFCSWVAVPIVSGDAVIGAVYLHESDLAQGALIEGIRRNLQNISMGIFVVALTISILFARTLTRRIKDMLSAIRMVGRGDYSYKMNIEGGDELTELSQAFNSLTDKLQETEEMRRRFVSDASHELKTPLASIRLLSDSIVQSVDMEEGTIREFVEDIGQEAARLTRITEKLLRLTRIDAQSKVELVPVDVSDVLGNAGHMLRPLADEREVRMTLAPAEHCVVLATEDDIYQIVFNLAENGIKYNVAGGTICIRLHRDEAYVYLTVEDTGIGIPDADMPYVFDRFYQVNKARSGERGSSGLGLSIVRDMVLWHGGRVDVESSCGSGTCVTVTFPALDAREEVM